ncbi:MAG: hypothetical protein QXW47_09965 [Candidatus Jordarchaeales archaeon]
MEAIKEVVEAVFKWEVPEGGEVDAARLVREEPANRLIPLTH